MAGIVLLAFAPPAASAPVCTKTYDPATRTTCTTCYEPGVSGNTKHCSTPGATQIIDVPVPKFTPLPSGDPVSGGGKTTGGGGTVSPPPSSDPVLGDPVRDGGGTTTSAPSGGGGETVTNKGEQNRRRLIEADEARRKSGSRAKGRLGYDDVESPDEGTKPKRRDKDWGGLSGQIGRLSEAINKARQGESGDQATGGETGGDDRWGLQADVSYDFDPITDWGDGSANSGEDWEFDYGLSPISNWSDASPDTGGEWDPWSISGGYTRGPHGVSGGYYPGPVPDSGDAFDEYDERMVSGSYSLGPGITLAGSIFYSDYDGEVYEPSANNDGFGVVAGIKLGF